ncbi:hypothetical protein ACFRAE_12695 [Sphingobacterium sp. HJSM2_6]|uniref:hypothetical protein n=1 Tax=Sphingobacterium sp. HJSM2_6 TaxID=3366264 RepID=UPI003BD801E7
MMKLLLISLFSCLFMCTQAQDKLDIIKSLQELKNKSHIDGEDSTMLKLYHELYFNSLQKDVFSLDPELLNRIQSLIKGPRTKNVHLLVSLLKYQDAIRLREEGKIKFDQEMQLAMINFMDQEFLEIYNQTPALVYIYKTETLEMNGQSPELLENIEQGLKAFPDCIPLKLYLYNNYKNEALKKELLQNHASHWLVKLKLSQAK